MKKLQYDNTGPQFSISDMLWLQQAFQEQIAGVVKMFLPKQTDAAIMGEGCVLTGDPGYIYISDGGSTGLWYERPAGNVIYQGKIYRVMATGVSGSFSGPDYSTAVGLKIIDAPDLDTTNYPNAKHVDNNFYQIYYDKVMTLVLAADADIPLHGLSVASNTAQRGTIVQFMIPDGENYTDHIDSYDMGIGRWRGWRRFHEANGKVLVGLDEADAVNFTYLGEWGGHKTHLLLENESGLRGHNHSYKKSSKGIFGGQAFDTDGTFISGGDNAKHVYLDANTEYNAGDSALDPHNNLQPYITVLHMIKL